MAGRCRDCDRTQHFGLRCDVCGNPLDSLDPFALTPPPASELERVEIWRLGSLLDAGYPPELAGPLAERPWHDVDLHQAVDLVAKGCPAELAARILL
jgi:hypothetical protein